MMQEIGYTALIEQKKMHHEIEAKIYEFKKKIQSDKPALSVSVTNELKNWFNNHILVEDKKYVELYKRIKTPK